MACRHVGKLKPPAVEKSILADEQDVGPLAPKSCESRIDLPARAGIDDLDLQPHGTGSRLHVSQRGLRIYSISRIDEHSHISRAGHQLAQQFQAFCRQLTTEKIDTC